MESFLSAAEGKNPVRVRDERDRNKKDSEEMMLASPGGVES